MEMEVRAIFFAPQPTTPGLPSLNSGGNSSVGVAKSCDVLESSLLKAGSILCVRDSPSDGASLRIPLTGNPFECRFLASSVTSFE